MLRLRPYKSCDAEKIVRWMSDERDFAKWSAGLLEYPLTAEALDKYYQDKAYSDDFWPMVVFDETGVVGQFIMRYPNQDKQHIRLGFIIVDGEKRGKGYGREMLQLAKQYAFDLLKVDEISLSVFENNPSAKKCYESVGFKETGEYTSYELLGEVWKCIEMKLVPEYSLS